MIEVVLLLCYYLF